jgi:IPT/TIG domain-containing protein
VRGDRRGLVLYFEKTAEKRKEPGTVPLKPTPGLNEPPATSGPVGDPVIVYGTNLGNGESAMVTFNGVTPINGTWTNTSIPVLLPSGATSGNAVVTIGGLPSNGVYFTVTP